MNSTEQCLYMARALELAERGLYGTDPNPRVGCVLVNNGGIVGEGWHVRAGQTHAEINAITDAGDKAKGSTAYVTLEPCSHHGKTGPCCQALIEAGVQRVIVAMNDPNHKVNGAGVAALEKAGIDVTVGIMQEQASWLNCGFIKRMSRGRPWVRCKMAASMDGRTAMASGESKWITGTSARADVQHWRARSSAIVTGVGTVLADDPSLTVRASELAGFPCTGHIAAPLRVVLDSRNRTPAHARICQDDAPTLLVNANPLPAGYGKQRSLQHALLGTNEWGLDLDQLLLLLAQRECNEVLVEAGARLAGSFLSQKLVDELVLYFAPALLGSQGRGMFNLPALTHLTDRIDLEIRDCRWVGTDLRIVATPKYA